MRRVSRAGEAVELTGRSPCATLRLIDGLYVDTAVTLGVTKCLMP